MMKHGLLLLVATWITLQGDTEKIAIEKEWSTLRGKWELEFEESDGAKEKPESRMWMIIKHRQLIMTDGRGRDAIQIDVKPTYSPKLVDFQELDGEKRKGEGIYDLNGDQLRIAIRLNGEVKERPTAFITRKHDGVEIFYLKRVATRANSPQ
jgi:uncharacterized protein (TIGR03067 family)